MRVYSCIAGFAVLVISFTAAAQPDRAAVATAVQSSAAVGDRTGIVPSGTELALQYEAYFGGFHVASGRTEIQWTDDGYRATARARARGLLDWYAGWVGEAQSQGGFMDDGQPAPARHSNEGFWRGNVRANELTYGADGTIALQQVSPPDPNKLTPIPEETIPGTIDPITAILTLSRALRDAYECAGELPVYDGRRRYDLTLEPVGRRVLEPNSYSVFSGEALECRVSVERIGGFRLEQSRYTETAGERIVFVASPIGDAPPVPVRIHVKTDYGDLIVHLTAVRYDGSEVALEPGIDNLAD